MNRRRPRRAGLVLLATGLLVAVLLPRALPRSIPGQAAMVPVAGPPAVGDCVRPAAGGWTAELGPGGSSYPPAMPDRCGGARSGEVIAVLPAVLTARPSAPAAADSAGGGAQSGGQGGGGQGGGAGGGGGPGDPGARCAAELGGYLGLAAPGGSIPQTSWQPLSTLATAVAGPTPVQRAAGQHWLSCIAYVAGIGGNLQVYDRTLRDGYSTGRLPRAAAQCLLTADPQQSAVVPCTTPHQAELFGSGWTATPVTALAPTCAVLVRHLTGMSDPTAAGALRVDTVQQQLRIVSIDPAGTPGSARSTGFTFVPLCVVTVAAHHALAGPLVDLGAAPVPWA